MKDAHGYLKGTPFWMWLTGFALVVVAIIPFGSALLASRGVLELFGRPFSNIQELGALGEFFGGHMSSCIGSMTLLVVLFFSYHQARQQENFFSRQRNEARLYADRQLLLDGINLIAEWDIARPGCDQALRLLDHYARFCLKRDDDELILILNTVITGDIKRALGYGGAQPRDTTYPFAFEVIMKIEIIREGDGRAQKARLKEISKLRVP